MYVTVTKFSSVSLQNVYLKPKMQFKSATCYLSYSSHLSLTPPLVFKILASACTQTRHPTGIKHGKHKTNPPAKVIWKMMKTKFFTRVKFYVWVGKPVWGKCEKKCIKFTKNLGNNRTLSPLLQFFSSLSSATCMPREQHTQRIAV